MTAEPSRPGSRLSWAPLSSLVRRGLAKSTAMLPPFVPFVVPTPGPLDGVLGKVGTLEVRLARKAKDVRRAQKLRYKVFYEEMSAVPDMMSRLKKRDIDGFDAICDHLLVIDRDPTRRKPKVVGTYRLLRQEIARRHGGFYTASEFDIAPMLAAHPGKRFLELGRSCVLPGYRDKRTVELLWHGIWTYVRHHRIDVMFGCASLEGTRPEDMALPLSVLRHQAKAPPQWDVRAVAHRRANAPLLPAEAIDARKAFGALPPLVKGYLRIGAHFGSDAVIDHQFGTVDVLVILPVENISPRYLGYFGVEATRYAA